MDVLHPFPIFGQYWDFVRNGLTPGILFFREKINFVVKKVGTVEWDGGMGESDTSGKYDFIHDIH